MLRGIYTSTTGMIAEMDRENVIANNLANVDTVGFKKDNITTTPFAELFLNAYSKRGVVPIGKLGLGVQAVTRFINFTEGPIQTTGNESDLAMRGDGMFAVQAQNGIRYMRAGNFVVDKDRFLVTQEGLKVLGQNGPIQLGEGAFQITENGEIIQNGRILDRLQVYSTAGMEKEGEYLYTNESPAPAIDFQVIQGAVEHSNVNTVYEMIQMITATRGYETNQKALTAHDDTLGKLVNELAR